MKKVWIYKRKSIKGWWVGWYESGKRKVKALPSKALAEHYHHIKYTQLNSDVFLETYKGQGSKWMEVWMKITGRKPIKCKDDVEQLKLKFGEDDGTS